MENNVFNELNAVNVNEHVEKKNTGKVTLSYLSWSWAWTEVKKRYPDANYEIVKFENGLPYTYDENTGYMVYTKVTIQGITHEMWLPVMDSRNEAMLSKAREVKTKYNSYTVEAATMFDVNKTIMRCLVKNLAMFGLGLYIYSGEDLPESDDDKSSSKPFKKADTTPPSEDAVKKCEELKSKLMDFEDVIPNDSWKDIDNAVKAGSVAFLQKMLSWATEESKKAS